MPGTRRERILTWPLFVPILRRLFDLDEEGGKKRLSALEDLAEVKIRLKKLKKEGELGSPEGKELLEKFEELSRKLDWNFAG